MGRVKYNAILIKVSKPTKTVVRIVTPDQPAISKLYGVRLPETEDPA